MKTDLVTSLGMENVDWRYVMVSNPDGTRTRTPMKFGMTVGVHRTSVVRRQYCRA